MLLAGCGQHQDRDFAFGPPDAVVRTVVAASQCGVDAPRVEKVARTAILRIDVATPEPVKACLHDWIVAHERDVRFPPKL